MSNFKKIMVLIGFLWTNRKRLATIKTEIEEAISVTKKALEDKKLSNEELKKIIKECRDVLEIIETILI